MTTVKQIVSKTKSVLGMGRDYGANLIDGWSVAVMGVNINPGRAGTMEISHNGKTTLRVQLVCDQGRSDFSQSKVEYFIDTKDRLKYNDYKEQPVSPTDRNALNSVLDALGVKQEFRIADGRLVLLAR